MKETTYLYQYSLDSDGDIFIRTQMLSEIELTKDDLESMLKLIDERG